jgi:hypothetical protein
LRLFSGQSQKKRRELVLSRQRWSFVGVPAVP